MKAQAANLAGAVVPTWAVLREVTSGGKVELVTVFSLAEHPRMLDTVQLVILVYAWQAGSEPQRFSRNSSRSNLVRG
jgi:hypothetical protein